MNDAPTADRGGPPSSTFHFPSSIFRAGLPLLLVLGVFLASCAGVANPQGWAGPQVLDDTLYASIDRGKMAALDPDDRSVRWVFPPDTDEGDKLDLEGIYGAPILADDFVYIAAHDGNVYALDAETGSLVWAFQTDDPIVNSLALSGGTLFAGSTDGRLYAIDARSGDETGRFDTGSSIWASPLVVDDRVYVATMDGELLALDADSLQSFDDFSFKTGAGLVMDPTLANDETLLVGGLDSKVYALDPASGDEKWSFEGGNWFWGRPLVDGDTVYIADLNGNVYAVGLDSGEPLWAQPFEADAAVRSAPLLAGDMLVIVDRDGNAFGLDPEDGTRQWGPTLLGKTVLSDPLLLEGVATSDDPDASPSASPGEESPQATNGPSPTPAGGGGGAGEAEVLIVAQGGDLCRIDPTNGSPVAGLFCEEVPL